MFLLLLAFLGGMLTIFSPCILPVLPFVFARSDQPFRRSGLPLLTGMVITFALIASLATVGGGWAVRANQFGRIAALILVAIFGLTLLSSAFAERLSRPFVQLGNRLSSNAEVGGNSGSGPSVSNSFTLGVGTGLLWAPCAGPILALVLTGAALSGASARTTLLLLSYALGAALSLGVALLAGGRVFAAMKRSLGAEEWIRRILGVAVLLGVVAVAFGLDRGLLTRLSLASTSGIEQRLIDRLHPGAMPKRVLVDQTINVTDGNVDSGPATLSDLSGATAWINSPPLTPEMLRGKVVLVDFWTYSCINCLRTLPYLKAWNEKYKESGLVIIGVHTPEFPFEKDEANVRKAVHDLGVTYPVAMDNNYRIWRSFNNEYWPAHYFLDATGKVRYHHFGEGNYDESEKWIRSLLEDANYKVIPASTSNVAATGAEAPPDMDQVQSPETYVGYERAKSFASPGGLHEDNSALYLAPPKLSLNEWAFEGRWTDSGQIATAESSDARIVYRFHARDLHLVLGPAKNRVPVRFRVTIDGRAPGADHGVDTNAEGYGEIEGNRLYQLIRQQGVIQDRTFRIEFLSPAAEVYAFTFG
jgi:cytochrome c biogenesis protein CcdA/thiol-disulfide isomerase/thioredoxin